VHTARMGRSAYGVLVWKPEEKTHLKEIGVEGRTILEPTLRTGWECVDCVTVASHVDRWRARVKTVMKLLVTIKRGDFVDLLRKRYVGS
jgi:hypothetical protein